MKHQNETTVMKQSKGLNGDLKPELKKTTNRTTMSPTRDLGSQAKSCYKDRNSPVKMQFNYIGDRYM